MDIKAIISSGLLENYALGLSSAEEKQMVEQWLRQYPEVVTELNAIEDSLEKYTTLHAMAPSKDLKENLFNQLNINEPETKPLNNNVEGEFLKNTNTLNNNSNTYDINKNWKWAAAASVLLLITSVVANIIFYNKYKEVDNTLIQTKTELNNITAQNQEMKTSGSVVSNPNSIPISLNGLATNPDAKAKIFWVKNSGDVFIDATNLPELPQGKQYQFWAIVNGVPVDGGLIIKTNKGSFKLQRMKSFGNAQAFAISLEKEGGNPTPTMVVSMGKVI